MKKNRTILPAFLFLLLLGIPSVVISLRDAGSNDSYVGAETCKGCHKDRYESYLRSNHSKKAIPGSPANKYACETCHGPGMAHVQKGGGRGTGMFAFVRQTDADQKSSRCLSCHQDSRAMSFWNMSRHKVNGISCDKCHSIHSGTGKKPQGQRTCTLHHLSSKYKGAVKQAITPPFERGSHEMYPVPCPARRVWVEDDQGGYCKRTLL